MGFGQFLKKSFIDPFSSMERAMLYLCAFLGAFGSYGLLIYLAFDYTHDNLTPVVSFFMSKIVLSHIVIAPIILILIRRYLNGFVFAGLNVLQWAGMAGLAFAIGFINPLDPVHTFLIGLVISMITEPFFAVYQMMMIRLTTDKNRGHEVSMAELSLKVGIVSGSIAAGFMLTYLPGIVFLIFSAICLIIPTFLLAGMFMQKQNMDDKLTFMETAGMPMEQSGTVLVADRHVSFLAPFKLLFKDIPITLLTILQGGMSALVTIYAPIWLKFVGFSALATSLVLGMQITARFFVGPLTGWLYEKGKGQELFMSSLIFSASWILWLVLPPETAFVGSVVLWAIYTHMMNVGLDGRWYAGKTLEGMACREVCFGIGRLALLVGLIPLLNISFLIFFLGSAAVGLLFFLIALSLDTKRNVVKE
ncbi:MAG: hypothetical protein CMH30_03335 [Micavibrio sp.]|nr:hypothetical protein [Micavibrio sp.]